MSFITFGLGKPCLETTAGYRGFGYGVFVKPFETPHVFTHKPLELPEAHVYRQSYITYAHTPSVPVHVSHNPVTVYVTE